jgi:protein required for attachment to host cells
MKQPTWILIADRARARLFESGADRRLNEIACFAEPAARAGEAELTTDRPPTVNESVGNARHSIEPHTTMRDKLSARFARQLGAALEAGRNEGRFGQLILVAPPRFLGDLHATLDKSVRACVVREIRHDLTSLSVHELGEHLSI